MQINKKTLIFIIILILLVITLFLLSIFSKRTTPPPSIEETSTPAQIITSPTPLPLPTLPMEEKIIKELPLITENYTIEYLPVPNKFFVLILKNPYEKYKTEAEKWFKSQNIELNDPRIFWGSIKGVAPKK